MLRLRLQEKKSFVDKHGCNGNMFDRTCLCIRLFRSCFKAFFLGRLVNIAPRGFLYIMQFRSGILYHVFMVLHLIDARYCIGYSAFAEIFLTAI